MNLKKYNIGIIGLGVGEQHLIGFLKNKKCNVKTICDFDRKKLKKIKKKYKNITTTINAEEVINDKNIDCVCVASFDQYHFSHCLNSLKKGKHIFVEKPLSLKINDLKKLESLSAKKKLIVNTNVIMRMFPRVNYIKRLCNNKSFGKIYYIEANYLYGRIKKITHGWRKYEPYYSVILGGGIHLIDMIDYLFGYKVKSIFSKGNNLISKRNNFNFNDNAVSIIQFSNNVIAKISSNFSCAHPHFHEIKIFGENKTVINNMNNITIWDRKNLSKKKIIKIPYPGVKKFGLIDDFISNVSNLNYKNNKSVFKNMYITLIADLSMKQNKEIKLG